MRVRVQCNYGTLALHPCKICLADYGDRKGILVIITTSAALLVCLLAQAQHGKGSAYTHTHTYTHVCSWAGVLTLTMSHNRDTYLGSATRPQNIHLHSLHTPDVHLLPDSHRLLSIYITKPFSILIDTALICLWVVIAVLVQGV